MMPFKARIDNLRDKAIEYIDEKVSVSKFNLGTDIFEYLSSEGEMQLCKVISVEKVGESIILNYVGEENFCEDYTSISEISTDLIGTIADRIHFEPLKHFEK